MKVSKKVSKKVSNSQKEYQTHKINQTIELARQVTASVSPWRAKRWDTLGFFNIHCCKTSKNERGPYGDFFRKKFHNAEKTERGNPLGFFNILYCRQASRKFKGDPLRKKFG